MYSKQFYWLNPPNEFEINNGILKIHTEPETDFWQRTHYGFQKTNAPAYLTKTVEDFTFSVKTVFQTKIQYDQCGILLYIDDENWVKISVEHENNYFARLGSVATQLGYSDWAMSDIQFPVNEMSYRVSLKGQDVLIEYAEKKADYKQMRILHLYKPARYAGIGVYACSPQKSSFEAVFSEFNLTPCRWKD